MQRVRSARFQRPSRSFNPAYDTAMQLASSLSMQGLLGWGGERERERLSDDFAKRKRERERYTENCRWMETGSTLPLIRTKNVIIKSFLMKHLFAGNCTAIDAPPGVACVILTQFWFLKWFIIGGY